MNNKKIRLIGERGRVLSTHISEEWRDIPSLIGYYQASTIGNIRTVERLVWNGKGYYTLKSHEIKKRLSKKGYVVVDVSIHGKHYYRQVHRLIAETFIPNTHNKCQVNHIDGNKQNNNVDNLEWCTNSENMAHAYKTGLKVSSEHSGRPKRMVGLFKDNMLVKYFKSIAEATHYLHCAGGNVKACCDGNRKHVKGYVAKYIKQRDVKIEGGDINE